MFAQAVQRIEGGATAGDEVDVVDPRGSFIGRGLYSPNSALVVRIFSRTPKEALDASLLERRIRAAIDRRKLYGLPSDETSGYRLVHAEGDELPGLVVDRFGDDLVVQFGSLGMKRRQSLVVDTLRRLTSPRSIVDKTSDRVAALEGFTVEERILHGNAPERYSFKERGLAFNIPRELGQKTGFYFDQRPLRTKIQELARGRRVLDTHTYVGAIALNAARGGASEVYAVDSSAPAIEVARECAVANGFGQQVRFERRDALEALLQAGRQGGYDLVICDPPKLAQSRATQRKAMANMRQLASAASRATRPGGLLALCSCSAALGIDELTRVMAMATRDVGLQATVLERLHQGPDHPVLAAFPEGLYLATLLVQIRPIAGTQ